MAHEPEVNDIFRYHIFNSSSGPQFLVPDADKQFWIVCNRLRTYSPSTQLQQTQWPVIDVGNLCHALVDRHGGSGIDSLTTEGWHASVISYGLAL